MAKPVADIVKGTSQRKFVAHWNVAVREDEEVNIGCGKQFAGVHYLMLVFTLKLERALVVGVATALRAIPSDSKSLPWVQHTVQQLVKRTVKHPLDKQIFALLSA